MADNVVQGIQRYGFRATPYVRRRPLDPARDASLCVLGGLKAIEEVKQYITEAADAGEPAFVMVSGKSGTGRTSVCNHLLAAYRDARTIDPELFAVPRIKVSGDDPFPVFSNWITDLYGELQRRDGLTPLGKAGTLDLDLALDRLDGFALETFQTKAKNWMSLAAQTLDKSRAGFGVCLEDVPSFPVVEASVAIFSQTPTLVLFTIFDSQTGVRDQFESLAVGTSVLPPAGDSYPVLELFDVQGQDAEQLIESRWPEAAKPSPFEGAKLAAAFDRPRSAARIMVLTGRLLIGKSATPGPPWPSDDLRFGEQELPVLINDLDHWVKEM